MRRTVRHDYPRADRLDLPRHARASGAPGAGARQEGRMTGADMLLLIGRAALLRTENGLLVPVMITDAKQAWGHLRYRVAPVDHGQTDIDRLGQTWVDATRVQLDTT